MSEARRTLGCWLLAAFLGRGCDPTTARVPVTIARVRPLSPSEAADLARRGGNLRVLPQPRPPSWRAAAAPSRATLREPSASASGSGSGSGEAANSGAASEAATILPFRPSRRPTPPTPPTPPTQSAPPTPFSERAC